MKHNKSLFVCCLLLILSATASTAQPYAQHLNSVKPYALPFWDYSNQMITLRSDLPSQSVLMSTLLADKPGDLSPVICAALWEDNGRHLECRSLLKFNFDYLPQDIVEDPSLINSAELILYPLQVSFTQHDENKPSKIIVRRVMDNWVDSTTKWINQPSSDSTVKVSKFIKAKNKNYPVRIDVTKLVIKMLRNTNHGFLISLDHAVDSTMATGQSFASPRFAFEEFHPLLVIDYRRMSKQYFGFNQWQDMPNLPVTTNFMSIQPAAPGPVMEPVKGPVTEPDKDPIKTNPVKE